MSNKMVVVKLPVPSPYVFMEANKEQLQTLPNIYSAKHGAFLFWFPDVVTLKDQRKLAKAMSSQMRERGYKPQTVLMERRLYDLAVVEYEDLTAQVPYTDFTRSNDFLVFDGPADGLTSFPVTGIKVASFKPKFWVGPGL